MSKWIDKPEVKKGAIGERIVNEILSKKGYIVYRPITEGSHKIDFFAHRADIKKQVICIEAKAKKRMACYYETGFDYRSYLHYMELLEKYNIESYVYFIDDFEECIYGAWLSNLGEGIRRGNNEDDVIVWNLSKMELYRKLSEEELIELKKYTKQYYDYSKTEKYFDDSCYDENGFYKRLNNK